MVLPSGYTRLEYIQSSGTQYINTRFKPNQNTRLILDFENTGDYSSMTTGLCPLLGARNASTASSASAFGLWIGSESFPHYGNVAYNANGSFTVDLNTRLTYEMNENVVSIGSQTITCSSATFTTNYNLCLLTFNNYGTIDTRRASGKLWAAKIYDNGTLVRDFVPCKNSSSVVGLYDLVNDTFYEDAAGGAFTAGAELIPSYKIVDSTLLDVAITATADAIRAKSGKSDDIPWGETSGFASAVSAIEGGSKIATGSITPSSASGTLTVSGLNFKPKHVVVMIHPTLTVTPSYTVVASAEYGLRTSYTQYMGAQGSKSLDNGDGYLSGTLSDGGFTLKMTGTSAGYFFPASPYNYIAIG